MENISDKYPEIHHILLDQLHNVYFILYHLFIIIISY